VPRTRRPTLLILALAAAAFLPFLGRRDIVISHEARVVQTARQMAESGWPWNATPAPVPAVRVNQTMGDEAKILRLDPDYTKPTRYVNPWIVPVLNDEIRLQKTPLPYWGCAVVFRLAGHWSEALARLIPALLGALATLLVADLARRTLGRRFALPAALVWVTTYIIPDEFRKVMADPYLAFFALLAIWAWIRAAIRHSPSSILVFYLAAAVGFLAKGPPLFVHLIFGIGAYHFCNRRRRPAGGLWLHLLGIAIFAAIALPWPIYILSRIPHAIEIWRYESLGELAENMENARPFWFYFPILFQISLPWTPLWVLACVLPFRKGRSRKRRRKTLFPLAWFALTVLFFSCVHMKKIAYLLPVMPAQTLLVAQALVYLTAVLRRRRRRHSRFTRRQLEEAFTFACVVIVIVLIGVFNFVRTPIENARSPRAAAAFLQFALQQDPNATAIPGRLPPEVSLYCPLELAYNRQADTILYLVDDLHNNGKYDLETFATRLPDLNLIGISQIPIPGQKRYKLFSLTIGPGSPKTFAKK